MNLLLLFGFNLGFIVSLIDHGHIDRLITCFAKALTILQSQCIDRRPAPVYFSIQSKALYTSTWSPIQHGPDIKLLMNNITNCIGFIIIRITNNSFFVCLSWANVNL